MNPDNLDDLYRKEAQDAHRPSQLSSILLPRRRTAIASIFAAVVFTVIFFSTLIFGSYTARVSVSGALQPDKGLVVVRARGSGVISELLVREGDEVNPQATLAAISRDRVSLGGSNESEIANLSIEQRGAWLADSLEAELTSIDAARLGIGSQIGELEREGIAAEGEVQSLTEIQSLAEGDLARVHELFEKRHVSQRDVNNATREVHSARANLNSVRRQLHQIRRQKAELSQRLTEFKAKRDAVLADHAAKKSVLLSEGAATAVAQAELVKAPLAGQITSLPLRRGQAIEAGDAIMTIQPTDSVMEAHLSVPTRALGAISVGNQVRLRLPAFPYQKFGHQLGYIHQISQSPRFLPIGGTGAETIEPRYTVIVRLEEQSVRVHGRNVPLISGMEVEADVLLESRTLLQWVLNPINTLEKSL